MTTKRLFPVLALVAAPPLLPGAAIESRVPWDVLEELRRRGHDLRIVGPFRGPTAVTAMGLDPKTGTLFGGADVRGERAIGGW